MLMFLNREHHQTIMHLDNLHIRDSLDPWETLSRFDRHGGQGPFVLLVFLLRRQLHMTRVRTMQGVARPQPDTLPPLRCRPWLLSRGSLLA